MFRFRALAFLGFMLLSLGLPVVLIGQQAPEEVQIPKGARDVKSTIVVVDGKRYWKITAVIDEEVPPILAGEALPMIDVQNPFGAVRVHVRSVPELQLQAHGHRTMSADDVAFARDGASFRIRATPPDGAQVNLDLTIPYGYLLRAETTDGDISYEGLGKAEFQTSTGVVSLRVPEELTSFELSSLRAPATFEGQAEVRNSGDGWTARDRLSEWIDAYGRVTLQAYGRVTLRAEEPRAIRVALTEKLPEDSPIQPHWRAKELLPKLFRFGRPKGLNTRDAQTEAEGGASEATFSADVRLVQLEVAATDREGRPAVGLTPADFEVVENGKSQQLVDDVSSAAAPFNLVLLLDCSSSTEQDRSAMEEAARRFIGTARPGDRVAVYALANTYFQVLSPLTENHEAAKRSVMGVQRFSGATPLYDAIVLAYAEELAALPGERNAMIVLSDGLDNEIYGQPAPGPTGAQASATARRLGVGAPSLVQFEDLHRAVREMRALIYPVVLDPVRSVLREDEVRSSDALRWAATVRQRSTALANASGGTVFAADSVEDLDEVYEQVARELRSVYTLAYRPLDQQFDGEWRRVRVRTKRKGIEVRTRPGYYAY